MNERDLGIYQKLVDNPFMVNTSFRRALDDAYSDTQVRSFLREAGRQGLFDRLLGSKRFTRYQQAVATSQLNYEYYNDECRLPVQKRPDLNLAVSIIEPNWTLCQTSEHRLEVALSEEAVLIVEPGLALKFRGRPTALCFESFSTTESTFIKGNWYSPVNNELRDTLEDSFDQGERRLDIPNGRWGLMRQSTNQHFSTSWATLTNKIRGIPAEVSRPSLDFVDWEAYRETLKELV